MSVSKHEVYHCLLGLLSLEERHEQDLLKRGISKEKIGKGEYRTMPIRRNHIVKKLAETFNLKGVPGFYKYEGEWKMSGMTGLVIPVRDSEGLIQNLKIRSDKTGQAGKYTLLSSNPKEMDGKDPKYPQGAKAVLGSHYPKWADAESETIRITEGELKADIATHLSNVPTYSIPGVSSWKKGVEIAMTLRPNKVIVSFDSDKTKLNSSSTGVDGKAGAVGEACAKLCKAIRNLGIEAVIEDWDDKYGKGIDDVLADGHADQIREMTADESEEFIDNYSNQHKGWCYIVSLDKFYNMITDTYLSSVQFDNKFLHEAKKTRPSVKALVDPSFDKFDEITYLPGKEKVIVDDNGLKSLNCYRHYDCGVIPKEGDVSWFIDHIIRISGDKQTAEHVLDYIAFIIQNPGVKMNFALFVWGKEGSGKSAISQFIELFLGHHAISVSNETAQSPYNGYMMNKMLITFEEMMTQGRMEFNNKAKTLITAPWMDIRKMRTDPFQVPNVCNFIMYSNHFDALVLANGDRRYLYVGTERAPADKEIGGDPDYFKKFFGKMHSEEGFSALIYYFLNRDLSEFNHLGHAPMTDAKEEAIKASRTICDQWVQDAIDDENWPFKSDIVVPAHLATCVPDYVGKLSVKAISKSLKNLGCLQLTQVRMDNGERIRPWAVRNLNKWSKATSAQIKEVYNQIDLYNPNALGNPALDSKDM